MSLLQIEQNREQQAIVVLAHAPSAGFKPSLAPVLNDDERLRLYDAILTDYADKVRSWTEFATVFLALSGAPADAEVATIRARFDEHVEIDITADVAVGRVAGLLRQIWDRGFRRIVFVSSDVPTLPAELARDAVEWLTEADVVVGPTPEGGYYLIGLRDRIPGLLDNVPWGTGDVFAATVQRALVAGLSVQLLPLWSDLDSPDDLRQLYHQLAAQASRAGLHGGYAGRKTWQYLNALTGGHPLELDYRFKGRAPDLPLSDVILEDEPDLSGGEKETQTHLIDMHALETQEMNLDLKKHRRPTEEHHK